MTEANVSTMSGERQAMSEDLALIADIRAGAKAVRARSATYLPRYEMESTREYARRVAAAPWRPEFVDSLTALAAKPFAQDVRIGDDADQFYKDFANDVDGRGNNLSRFAREAFEEGIASGVHLIIVDFPTRLPQVRPRTIAEDKADGFEPYWVHIAADRIISLRTTQIGGREVVTHLRFTENTVEQDGFGEKTVERIRLLEPGLWQLWQLDDKKEWQLVDEGTTSITDEVPVALFFTGQRLGTLRTKPPLRDLAEVQVELFRAMSRQDEVLTYAGSPMLAAIGIAKPEPGDAERNITIGPKAVLFAPPLDGTASGKFDFISPDAAVLTEIRNQVGAIVTDMRRLGMQPNTPQSGGVTATATSVEAAKAHSALQAWAMGLKDALEVCFYFTSRFLAVEQQKPVTVEVFTDFVTGDQSTTEATVLLLAERQLVLSKQTVREELKRRSLLGPDFQEGEEDGRIAIEQQGVESEGNGDDAAFSALYAVK